MAFVFDIEAAINAIATLENAIPEVNTSYTYGNNPTKIEGDATLPAIVHYSEGPQPGTDAIIPGWLASGGVYQLYFDIHCQCFINETVGLDNYNTSETASNTMWLPVANAYYSLTAMRALASQANARNAFIVWAQPSYTVLPYPPDPYSVRDYWSLDYRVRFLFAG